MAGIFAPAKKYRLGSGGGTAKPAPAGGVILGIAAASLLRPSPTGGAYRAPWQTKQAFGGSSQSAVSRRAIAAFDRTARRAPEVVVRITGRQHGGGHVLANFAYISRLGHGSEKELALYTSDGDVLRDGRDMQVLAQDWHEWEMGDDARRKGATSISMILSMPTGTDPERLKEAALDFARTEFANRSWVASLHVDRDHPHVHLTVARRDLDGRRFHPDRDDLFRYRQRFAEKLRDRGIEANATPAKARGLDPKHEPIAAKKVREKGQTPRLDRSRSARAARYRDAGLPDPVDAVLAGQQAGARAAYERSIAELSSSPSIVDKTVAKSLERFVNSMSAPEPNSIRKIVPGRARAEIDRPPTATQDVPTRPVDGDPLAAALARSQAMRDRLEASRDTPARSDLPPSEVARSRALPGATDRLRALLEQADQQSKDTQPTKADDTLRQTQERNRHRDRPPDKGGPRR
ncbi:MAG: hypothetical protein DI605_20430 [Sphingomonas sp.]|nr:MAG: hypothetical protein DI605_20430 [Sphingomonas sp.]